MLKDTVEFKNTSLSENDSICPLKGIPKVRVIDENGNEVMRGWYAYHEKRQICPIGEDSLEAHEVAHIVIHDSFADWNMPRTLVASEITPPHRIEIIEEEQ